MGFIRIDQSYSSHREKKNKVCEECHHLRGRERNFLGFIQIFKKHFREISCIFDKGYLAHFSLGFLTFYQK